MLSGKTNKDKNHKPTVAESIANTFEWLITAFILALVFRAFVMEAFRIPTGSMADTLRGAHFQLRCPQCAHKYNSNFMFQDRYGRPQIVKGGHAPLMGAPRCPSCGYFYSTRQKLPIANGDRILVLKCLFQFKEPNRWDVTVFKNPRQPRENYIKRMIGRPGEKIEIIDGDIYVNDKIARKPPKVQRELWMPIYHNDYQPVEPMQPQFNGHQWSQPFVNLQGSDFQLGTEKEPTIFLLNSQSDKSHVIAYDTRLNASANDFTAAYAYNSATWHRRELQSLPTASDIMTKFYVDFNDESSMAGIALRKYTTLYTATVTKTATMKLTRQKAGSEPENLVTKELGNKNFSAPTLMQFANVDHMLTLNFNGEKLTYDLGKDPNDLGPRTLSTEPKVYIIGRKKIKLSHIQIYRDIHYVQDPRMERAGEGNPVTLGEDQYFVLGDNSPASDDSRFWSIKGLGNNGKRFREGIVPREYLVGKAFFVYWPSGFRPSKQVSIPLIPNVGDMKFIVGGNENYN